MIFFSIYYMPGTIAALMEFIGYGVWGGWWFNTGFLEEGTFILGCDFLEGGPWPSVGPGVSLAP